MLIQMANCTVLWYLALSLSVVGGTNPVKNNGSCVVQKVGVIHTVNGFRTVICFRCLICNTLLT